MKLEENVFQKATVDFDKLTPYGFEYAKDKWIYTQTFMDGQFKAVVVIDKKGNVSGTVYETDSEDIYFPLRVEDMAAGFVGQVREGYVKILEDIKAHCCKLYQFNFKQTNRIVRKIFEAYGDEPDFPWTKYNEYGVFRNPDNAKWYALVMNIAKNKLDKNADGNIDVVNLKLSEDKIPQLITQKGFYPAYHMNKKSWITVTLDDTLADENVLELVAESHAFTLYKKKRGKTL